MYETLNLRDSLLEIMDNYQIEKNNNFAKNGLANFTRNHIPKIIENLDFIDINLYKVKGSVGQGNWASVPWIAIMNKNVTITTQEGYYIVYLFSENMQNVFLTLAQGVTKSTREEMNEFNLKIRDKLSKSNYRKENFIFNNNFSLGESDKAGDYVDSTAIFVEYKRDNMPSNKELESDLNYMIRLYEEYIKSLEDGKSYDGNLIVKEKQNTLKDFKELINHIYNYILSKGFNYSIDNVINLYQSLRSKPFVIISGISGTGKTKIVQLFAESVGANEKNGQFKLIPVRPDWSDSSDLLGYIDLKGEFKQGPLLNMVDNAIANPDRPYFVLLDEMNLARVEHYFSDVLSVMESRKKEEDGKVVSSNLLPIEMVEREIQLPSNLYIIGTVNMDETTHPFSKKVLDRANTIEFNDVQLDNFDFLEDKEDVRPLQIHQEMFEVDYLKLKDVYNLYKDIVVKVTNELVKINASLKRTNSQIGYRVRDEICFYLAYNDQVGLLDFNNAFDFCIMQKILPRIAGSDSRVAELLEELKSIFNRKYPKSMEKVQNMIRGLEDDGFTSFWIA